MKPIRLLLLATSLLVAIQASAQTWVFTNLSHSISARERIYWDDSGRNLVTNDLSESDVPYTDYIREGEITPSLNASVPHASAYYNNAARIFYRQKHEALAMTAHGAATYGGKVVSDYAIGLLESLPTNAMTRKEIYLAILTNKIHMTAGYYRGRVHYSSTNWSGENWITAFSSEDKTRLVLARDEGPIYFSENSGLTWKTINAPGQYEFTLATTPKGSALVAVITIAKISDPAELAEVQRMTHENWYSTVSGTDGKKLVITGGPSQSAPVLSISHSDLGAVISWSSTFTNFVLQQCSDLAAADWLAVTNPPVLNLTNLQNQVTLPASGGNAFFRLKTP